MRIQKKDNGLYQAKLASTAATNNASSIITLNSNLQTINSAISPVSGNINALSGNITTLNNNVTTVSGNLVTLSNNTNFAVAATYSVNSTFSTNSTSVVEIANLAYTKKSGTRVLITVSFGLRTTSFTGGGSTFYYSTATPTSWSPIGSPVYKVSGTVQTSQAVVIDGTGSGAKTFRLGANVNVGTSTIYVDNYSIIIEEIN